MVFTCHMFEIICTLPCLLSVQLLTKLAEGSVLCLQHCVHCVVLLPPEVVQVVGFNLELFQVVRFCQKVFRDESDYLKRCLEYFHQKYSGSQILPEYLGFGFAGPATFRFEFCWDNIHLC